MKMAVILRGINYLARIAKTRELTIEETILREELRGAYLAMIRKAFRNQIETVKFVDETGTDVTPEKLKEVQREKGIHGRHLDLPTRMAQFLDMIPELNDDYQYGEFDDEDDEDYEEEDYEDYDQEYNDEEAYDDQYDDEYENE